MKIHVCSLSRDCRKWGAPARIHITMRNRHWAISLTPANRIAVRRKDAPTFSARFDPDHYRPRWVNTWRT